MIFPLHINPLCIEAIELQPHNKQEINNIQTIRREGGGSLKTPIKTSNEQP